MVNNQKRKNDITRSTDDIFTILVDGKSIPAIKGESVLSTMFASGIRTLMKNDYGENSGAFCGMGVCHCCLVVINHKHKQKACQTKVKPGMKIQTNVNLFFNRGKQDG